MENEKDKKQEKQSILSIVGRVAVIIAILFLVSYLITMLQESKTFFRDSSARSALAEFEESVEDAEDLAQEHYDNLYAIADEVKYAQTREEVIAELKSHIGSDDFGSLRFYSQGKGYDAKGALVEEETYGQEQINALVQSNKQGCTSVYYDGKGKFDCMAFFVPVRGSQYVDGILSILKVHVWTEGQTEENIPILDTSKLLKEDLLAAVLIDASGTVYGSSASKDLPESIGNDFRKFIAKMTADTQAELDMQNAVNAKTKTACHIEGVRGEFVLTVAPIENLDGHLYLITMTERDGLIAPELKYVRYIIGLTVIAIVAFTVSLIYAYFYHRNAKQKLAQANYTDPVVGCANAEKFRADTDEILREKKKGYAVAVFEIRQFDYLEGTLDEEALTDILKHVAKVMDTFCAPQETYGYLGNGKFALLMFYVNEKSAHDRARLTEAVVGKNAVLGANKSKKIFNIGVATLEQNGKNSAQELLIRANSACQSAKNNVTLPFVIYNEQVNDEKVQNARIELEMESALANNEFRLFLQPKYNIATDRIDSAEALVRWFDPKTGDYRFPGEFISLFEANRFITKLDHYMYIEVLKYLQSATERGEKQVPISVNVSLVTANESDFLTFYIENKKKYGIPDGFITIEFTESFLAEDHQKLHDMVERLHRNGISCSLDDFGTGYASFSLLKDVAFDELKLDRTLLGAGLNDQDDVVRGTIVQLAKSLGMRVVQEGVETKAMFDKVVENGCNVVQGYYYAKAIPLEEYRLFLGSNTSIKYKSRVK